MGMGYRWAGSASYGRFERELEQLAALFGGTRTGKPVELVRLERKRKRAVDGNHPLTVAYYTERIMREFENWREGRRFEFPHGTDETLARFLNDPYGHWMTPQDTKVVGALLLAKVQSTYAEQPEMTVLRLYRGTEVPFSQIVNELQFNMAFDESWMIY